MDCNINAFFSFDIFNTRRYEILHTVNMGVVLLLSESHAIINDLYVILHGFMLQIIYTTVLLLFLELKIPCSVF